MVKIDGFALSSQGVKRENNEDSFYYDEAQQLFMVADGMGGATGGEVASKVVVDMVKNAFIQREYDNIKAFLINIIAEANTRVLAIAEEHQKISGMATTLTLAKLHKGEIVVANVGDSRTYLIRDGEISRLTFDHSAAEELFRDGIITAAEAKVHPNKNVLTRAVGGDIIIDVDIRQLAYQSGDTLLLCSDGLTKVFDDDEILDIMLGKKSWEFIGNELLTEAISRGSNDDISIIIAHISGEVD